MDNKIDLKTVVTRFKENNLPFGILPLQNGMRIVISQRGGRVFGPFLDDDSPSFSWINKAFAGSESFKEFLLSGHWNLGGERIWIAPEIQYGCTNREDFFGSLHLQAAVDPGHYQLEQTGPGHWRLHQAITLQAHVIAAGEKDLRIDRLIRPVEDPLRYLSNYQLLIQDIRFAGYEQIIDLQEYKQDDIVSEVWSLFQLNPGGVLLVPTTGCLEYNDYYNPVDELHQSIYSHHVSLKITGDRQYKVGYKSATVFGRLGYFNSLPGDRAYLIVRNFFNNPSAAYTEEIDRLPGSGGYSIHVYNDDGGLGGFGELECNGQAIGGYTGRNSSTEQLVLWFYTGETGKVKNIARHLLGVDL